MHSISGMKRAALAFLYRNDRFHFPTYLVTHAKEKVARPLAHPNRCLKFHKGRQLFLRSHNETLSVVAVCISNEDRLPFEINR
jgi:hypothetical protein